MADSRDSAPPETSETTRDGTAASAEPSSSTQHTSADVAPELFEP
ncbi:hypothetical protein [Halogranum amylolyticum]|nr:hypothetical protein [Halogranum amylolyticum]